MSDHTARFNIFVSYSHKNKTEVNKLCEILKIEGYTLWIDHEQIVYGNLDTLMKNGIDDSEYFMCCLSESYSQGKNTLFEYNYAIAQGKQIVFVIFEYFKGDEKRKDKFKPINLERNVYYKHENKDAILKAFDYVTLISTLFVIQIKNTLFYIQVKKPKAY